MSGDTTSESGKRKTLNPRDIGLSLTIIIIVSPIGVQLGWSPYDGLTTSFLALLYMTYAYGGIVINPPYAWFAYLPFAGLRFVFVYFLMKYYQNKTTRGRLIGSAILGELPLLAMGIISLIPMLLFPTFLWFYIIIPVPIPPIIGLIMLKTRPPPMEPEIWDELPDSAPWWEKSESIDSSPTKPPEE